MESFGKEAKENRQARKLRKPMHQIYDTNSPFVPFSKIDQNLNLQKRNTFSGDDFRSGKSAFKPYQRPADASSQKMRIS
jgi:hypothetical protein